VAEKMSERIIAVILRGKNKKFILRQYLKIFAASHNPQKSSIDANHALCN
jgi:hypothetical protein